MQLMAATNGGSSALATNSSAQLQTLAAIKPPPLTPLREWFRNASVWTFTFF